MSKFTTPLIVKVHDDGANYELVEGFEYYRENDKKTIIKVPKGFVTDFASVPRVFWSIFPPFGRYSKAAVLHDYLYDIDCKYMYSRAVADEIFLEAMTAVGVKKITRNILYYCVKWFAKSHFRR